MSFKLSKKSLKRLEGVHPDIVAVVKRAIELTPIDFGVTCGLRDLKTQERLVREKRSQTLKSKHLPQADGYSHAVDVVAYDSKGDICWEASVYDDICDAFALACKELLVDMKWGAAWSEGSIRGYTVSAEEHMNRYIDLRRSEQRRPFIDCPHFQLC